MVPQIRISKTPKIREHMDTLTRVYPTLDESEIIKFLIGKEIVELMRNRDDNDYYSLIGISPSYGRFPDEKDDDENLYSAKDAKPLNNCRNEI